MLRTALDGCGMRAVYQPIIDLTRGVTVGYEALIRFVGYPIRNPGPWFAAAREHGLNAPLQAAALRAALADRDTLPAELLPHRQPRPRSPAHHGHPIRLAGPPRPARHHHRTHRTHHHRRPPGPRTDLDRLRAAGARIAVDDTGPEPPASPSCSPCAPP